MKHFESSGLWSPAGDLSNTVGGTLRYDSEGLNLKLLGSFREGWSAGVERYPTIRGLVDENPYGTFVTLIDCLRKQSRFNMAGVTSETIRCGKATIGTSHLPDGEYHFEKLEVFFSYLKDWVGQTGIKFEVINNTGYSINYTKPEMLSFPFGDQKLTLAPTASRTYGIHHAELDEETLVVIEPIGEHSPTELGGDHIQILQNLLTFATDTPNEIEDITYLGTEDDQGLSPEYHLVFDPIFRLKTDKASLHSSDMLFTFRDAQDHGLNIFQNWLDFTERHPSFCTVFFANLYAEPRYLNDRFASLMLAFTLLGSTIGEVSERTKLFLRDVEAALKSRFRDEEGELLGHIIPTGAEIEMPFHLLRLLQENADTMGRFIEDMPGFVRSVSDTLDFFKRRSESKRPYIQGVSLLHAMLKIRLLVKIVILKELGFGEDTVRSLVTRNNRINFLRTV
jgi:ApeA N-terminal domain 1